MPSNFIKILLVLTGLFPAFLLLYIIKLKNEYKHLSIYLDLSSAKKILTGVHNLISIHYLLLFPCLLLLAANHIINYAKKHYAVGRIEIESSKPADPNILTVLLSYCPLLAKFYDPEYSDIILAVTILFIGFIIGLTTKGSYHYNPTLKLLLGYRHYEVQTKKKITYLIISKTPVIHPNQVSRYITLADHMLINIPE